MQYNWRIIFGLIAAIVELFIKYLEGVKLERFIIKSNRIYTPDGIISGGILISGKIIEKIVEEEDLMFYKEINFIDAKDNLIIPGLIDIHIHGSGGWAIDSCEKEQIKGMCRYLTSVGVTSFHPTLGGEEVERTKRNLNVIGSVMEEDYDGAKMLGIHMEGPFLNPEKKGIFRVDNLLNPSIELMESFMEESKDNIIHVTVAPELGGAKELIEFLVENDILVSGGHTNATIDETKKGIQWGITLSNHTCNAQSSIHHREPGALGGYLLDDEIYCELICDFFHVHPDMIKLILKMKSSERVCMISDAVVGSGLKPGKYNFSERVITIDEKGWSKLADGTIAGSAKSLLFGFKNLVQLGYSIEEVIKMSSYIPAKLSNVDSRKGTIEVGKDADLVILDNDYNVKMTYVEGKICFDSDKDKVILNNDINILQ